MTLSDILKAIWMKIQLRGTLYGDKGGQFDKAYKVKDPWQMGSEREQLRFQETNRIIDQDIGHVTTLLEVGCGEGHQTEHFIKLCDRLYGFDVSDTAVARAMQRCPGTRLVTADIFSYQPPQDQLKFDLVVACEVLYYIKDVPAALARMNELGRNCLVTYFESGPHILDPFFASITNRNVRTIQVGDTRWKLVWWKAQ